MLWFFFLMEKCICVTGDYETVIFGLFSNLKCNEIQMISCRKFIIPKIQFALTLDSNFVWFHFHFYFCGRYLFLRQVMCKRTQEKCLQSTILNTLQLKTVKNRLNFSSRHEKGTDLSNAELFLKTQAARLVVEITFFELATLRNLCDEVCFSVIWWITLFKHLHSLIWDSAMYRF